MGEVKHGRPGKHDILEDTGPEDTSGVWMLSYIDVMTLLVALFALLLAIAAANSADEPNEQVSDIALADEVSPGAIVVALGVGNGAPASALGDAPRVQTEGALMLAGAIEAWRQPALPGTASSSSGHHDGPVATHEPLALAEHLPAPVKQIDPSGVLALRSSFNVPEAFTAPPSVMLDQRLNLAALGDLEVVVTPAAPTNTVRLSPEAVASARDLSDALDAQLADAKVLPSLEGVEVSSVSEGLNLRIQDRLVFESAAADLTEIGEDVVNRLVSIIQRYDGTVSVEGHTDSRDIATDRFPSNWELSSARATAILRQLQAAGVDAKRLRAIGYGDTRPLESNDTPEGRSANRRVEVIVHL